jgi:tetratricopeptide (TPR) repeat protein
MKLGTSIMRMVFLLFILHINCFVLIADTGYNSSSQTKTEYLSDSLFTILMNISDTSLMPDVFQMIKKNRQNLQVDYLNLLHAYDRKSEQLGYLKGRMETFDRIGLQHRYDGRYDSAINYHNKSLQLALLLKDSTQLYYNYNNLGQVYRMQDINTLAILNFHKALEISDAIHNKKSSSFTMNTLGATYVVQKQYDLAMKYFRQSAEIAVQLNDKRTLAYNYGSMGEVFLLRNQNDSAMFYFIESKNIIIELGSKRGYAVAEHLIGQAHFALNNFALAEKHFNLALPFHIADQNFRYQAMCYAYLGKIKHRQQKSDSAIWLLNKSLTLANKVHSLENLILAHKALFEVYSQSNQWGKAVTHLQQSHQFQDSIHSLTNAKELNALEVLYELKQKQQQIDLLSVQNLLKSQRIKMSISIIAILLISIIMGIYNTLLRQKQARLERDTLKQQLFLSQMNPHFIYNALGSIQCFMYKNDAKKAAAYMGNFAALSRAILHHSSAETIPLEDELQTLKNYIELEKMRMNESFKYDFQIPDSLETAFIQIPPMMLQPFVENALKHGIKEINYPGEVLIVIRDLQTMIKIEITDNGIGYGNAPENKSHKSKATRIFDQRMKILQKKYRKLPPLKIEYLDTLQKRGTKVTVYLPIISN